MKLSSILNPNLMCVNVQGSDRKEIYTNLLLNVAKHAPLHVSETVQGMMGREDDIRIPYEMGLAVPHFRNPDFNDLFITVGILETPVKLKENDISETKVIVMSLISESTSDTYLKALSAFSRFFMQPGNADKLKGCTSSKEILKVLDKAELKKNLTAEDIMTTDFPVIDINAPVSEALNTFTRENRSQIPVTDANGILQGMLDASNIIGRAVPQYIMDMDSIKFLTSFEPFEQILSEEEDLMVKDYIREPNCMITPHTPLIQVTLPMVRKEARNLLVVDDNKQLVGIVTFQEVINKVLRG